MAERKATKVILKYPDLGAKTEVYGFVVGDNVIEAFAANPQASGLDTSQAGRIHAGVASDAIAPGYEIRILTDEEWTRGFFNE